MAIGAVVAGAAKGTFTNIAGGVASSGASGGNQNPEDPFAGGILSRIGGTTADPQTYFALPRKIRNVRRNEKLMDQQIEMGSLNIEASRLALDEEKRKQEWNSNLRRYLYGGRR